MLKVGDKIAFEGKEYLIVDLNFGNNPLYGLLDLNTNKIHDMAMEPDDFYAWYKDKKDFAVIKSKSKINIPQYPNEFDDFSEGVNINNQTINKWIKECIDELENDKESGWCSRSSGNTYVNVTKYYHNESDEYEYQIVVAKNYHKTYIESV
jgi:hypothetical protein